MKRYVVLYRAPLDVAERFAQASAEEAQRGLQAWTDWMEKVGPALIDPGKPLGNPRNVTSAGVTGSDTNVIGMSILQAESMDEALGMVSGHHHLRWAEGCEITVLEETVIPETEPMR
jgi:hypothetical protein